MIKKDLTEITAGISSALKKKKLTFFVGAGVSASCGIPLWRELRSLLFKEIAGPGFDYEKIKEHLEKNRNFKLPEGIENYPELIFSIAEEVYGKTFTNSFLHRHLSQFIINHSYKAILSFIRGGYLTHIFTVNQDAILQKLLTQKQIPFYDVIPYINKSIFLILEKENKTIPTIFSLHGNLLIPNSILTDIDCIISNDLDKIYNKYNFGEVQTYLNDYDYLVIIGYRGADRDIIKLFIKYLQQNSKSQIIWLYRSNQSFEYIKNSIIEENKELKIFAKEERIQFSQIESADRFFRFLTYNFNSESIRSKVFLKSISPPDHKFLVKVYGSVAVIGDYGVYANGKMVQYTLNLPCIILAEPSESLKIKFRYFDPFNNQWQVDEERGNKIQNIIFQFFNNLGEKFNYSIVITQFFPPSSGLGDTEPAGITVLLYHLGYRDEELLWNIFQTMSTKPLYYDHSSYLRPFASFFPSSFYTIGIRNFLPDKINYKNKNWIEGNRKISLNQLNLSFTFHKPELLFAIGFLPRGLKITSKAKISLADTGAATEAIQSPGEFCKQIGEMTEIFLEKIQNRNYKLAGQCLYNVATLFFIKNIMREIELSYIEKLVENNIIIGGKISGSGPGGGQVYLCEPNISPFAKGEEINEIIYPYFSLLEISEPIGKEKRLNVVSIKELIKKFFRDKNGCFQPVKKES